MDGLLGNKQPEMQPRKFAATLVDMLAQCKMITVEREEVRQRTEYLLKQGDPSDSCLEPEQNERSSESPAICRRQPTTNSEFSRCEFTSPEMTLKCWLGKFVVQKFGARYDLAPAINSNMT